MPDYKCVVLLSGGVDSTTLLGLAMTKFSEVHAVSFHYGQKHSKELEYAKTVAKHYGITHQIIELPKIFAGAGSSLVDQDVTVETIGTYGELQERYGAQPTVVPNRNMVMISMAVVYALTMKLDFVGIAAHAGDAHQYHYPDCRPAFNGAMASAIDIATQGEVSLWTPFNHMTKGEVVGRGLKLNAPMHLTLSCYNGKTPACGNCATCKERIQAFIEAGFIDPIPYAIEIDWKDARPAYWLSK